MLTALPSVARNHAAALEAQLAALLAAPPPAAATTLPAAAADGPPAAAAAASAAGGGVPTKVRTAAARALALLPRAHAADAEAWSGLARRALLSLHAALDLMFFWGGGGEAGAGVDGGLGARVREMLEAPAAPPGAADAEGLLGPAGFVGGGGGSGGGTSSLSGRPGVGHALAVAAGLVDLLEALLGAGGGGCGAAVPLPAHVLLLTAQRLLRLEPAGEAGWGKRGRGGRDSALHSTD